MPLTIKNHPAHATRHASSPWQLALELAADRSVTNGNASALAAAVRRGADLRIYTEFFHEEHIAPFSLTGANHPAHDGLIREVIDFRQTILVDDHHVAGITLYRQPLEPTQGFNGLQPKMAFFMYNMTGHQSCADCILEDRPFAGMPGTRQIVPASQQMVKMSETEVFDADTSGASRNFIYDMEVYRFFVRDDWEQVLAHDAHGRVTQGSFEAIEEAQLGGRELKVGIAGLCDDLRAGHNGAPRSQEIFSLLGSSFLHTGHGYYEALTHPIVRVVPNVPMKYASHNWDVCWAFVRTDGHAVLRTLNPYTRRFADRATRLACRWFVR